MKSVYDVVIRPIITEQSMEAIDLKKYSFEVAPDAGKAEIKNAIEKIFSVKVEKITTQNISGKTKRVGRYPEGTTKKWKKATVRLTADSKPIELFEGMV